MFISTILPPATVKPTTEKGWPSANDTTPGAPLTERAPALVTEPVERGRAGRHGVRPADDSRSAQARRTAVGPQHDVGVEHREEPVEVAVARGREERVDELPLLGEVRFGCRCRAEATPRTAGELSRGGL